MEKLYGLVQAGGFSFEAFGVAVGVRSNTAAVLSRIQAHLPQGSRLRATRVVERVYSFFFNQREASSGIHRLHVLYGDERILARSENQEDLYHELEQDLAHYLSQASSS